MKKIRVTYIRTDGQYGRDVEFVVTLNVEDLGSLALRLAVAQSFCTLETAELYLHYVNIKKIEYL